VSLARRTCKSEGRLLWSTTEKAQIALSLECTSSICLLYNSNWQPLFFLLPFSKPASSHRVLNTGRHFWIAHPTRGTLQMHKYDKTQIQSRAGPAYNYWIINRLKTKALNSRCPGRTPWCLSLVVSLLGKGEQKIEQHSFQVTEAAPKHTEGRSQTINIQAQTKLNRSCCRNVHYILNLVLQMSTSENFLVI